MIELLGQNLTEEDEEAIADELDSILAVKMIKHILWLWNALKEFFFLPSPLLSSPQVELPEVPSGGMEDIGDKLPEVPTETPTLGMKTQT